MVYRFPSPWRAIAKVQAVRITCTLAVGDSNQKPKPYSGQEFMQSVNIVELQATNVAEVEAVLIDGIIVGYLGKIKDTNETFKSQCLQIVRLYHQFGGYEQLRQRTFSNPCWGNGWEWNERKFAHGHFPLVAISESSSWFTGKHLVSSFVGQVQGLKLQMSQEPKPPRDGFYYFPVNA